jgi:uncharacterized membrane protein required for colicin V production
MAGLGDAVFGVVILLFLAFGFKRGLSLGLFSVAGFIVVLIAALSLAKPLGQAVGNAFGLKEPAVSGFGFAIVFGLGLGLLFVLGVLVKRLIAWRKGGFVNSVAGTLLWGVLGFAFIVLCLSALLVSHHGLFDSVAYDRSAACRFIFDRAPLVRDLKARVERPREPKEEKKPAFEEVDDFRHGSGEHNESKTDH